jgi:hypothetical protein
MLLLSSVLTTELMFEPTHAATEAPVRRYCSLPKTAIIAVCFSNSTNQVHMEACNDLKDLRSDATKQTEERGTQCTTIHWCTESTGKIC